MSPRKKSNISIIKSNNYSQSPGDSGGPTYGEPTYGEPTYRDVNYNHYANLEGASGAAPAYPNNNDTGNENGYNTRRSHETNNAQNDIKGDLPTTKKVIIDMHDKGELQGFIDKIISQFGLYISIIIMLLMAPSMPIIFYLTILYNVIILTWENFKALDVDNIEG